MKKIPKRKEKRGLCNSPSLHDNRGIGPRLKFFMTRLHWKGRSVEKMVKLALNNVRMISYF